ncbi:MAG: hypothetical protein Q9167_002816 [Letrouitia subvulpina]
MDVLIDRLQVRQDLSQQNSLRFLSLLFEEYGYDCERWRRELDRDVVRLETKTRMTSLALAHTLDNQTLDYESLTKRLHRCHTDLIFLDTVQNFEACLGNFCKKAAVQLETMRQQLGLEASSVSDQNIFFQNVEYHLNQNELRRFQTLCLQKRIQTQINVLYSLISQRDSRINLTVAHDSKTIAAAAMRDSKAMRTVAVLTLVFLPATLIASVFSTGIFNLRGANDKQDHGVVARLWWVFVLVCVLLTGTVLAAWALYTRHKTKNEDYEKG